MSRHFYTARRFRRRTHKDSGQAGLVVLLLTVVLLTIGISIASRSTIDVGLQRQEEESNRVFNAAEAGVEEALSQDLDFSGETFEGTTTVDDSISVDYKISKVNVLETRLFEGVSAQADVTGVANGQGITISWAKERDCGSNPAALLVTIFSQSGATVTSRSAGYTPCNRGDNFEQVSPGGSTYFVSTTVPLQAGDMFVRIKPLYNDTYVQVAGANWTLPIQYYKVTSTAQNDVGQEVRVVEVNKTTPVAPSIFDFVLFSGNSITK